MKKVIAILLSLVMMFTVVSVVAYAADDTATTTVAASDGSHGNSSNDEQYEGAYSLLNFFTDLFERINLLIEYIVTVFFPNVNAPDAT